MRAEGCECECLLFCSVFVWDWDEGTAAGLDRSLGGRQRMCEEGAGGVRMC